LLKKPRENGREGSLSDDELPKSGSLSRIERMTSAVCLVSGGLDSCVTAAEANAKGFSLAFLHISYGQLAQSRELQAYNAIADHYSVINRLAITVEYFSRIGGSALTDESITLPEGDLDREEIPISYVPFRNANLLSIAASWAEVLGAGRIYIGAVEEDCSGYPDCRESFFAVFNQLIKAGTKPETEIEVVTPLIHLGKKEIVLRGKELGAPLELTWSCYRNEKVACGSCDSCLLRLRGFREAGVVDPVPYLDLNNEGLV
jgi:7-cyano-7-deazaguanine synthase